VDPRVESSSAGSAQISHRECDADFYACRKLPLLMNFPKGEGFQRMTVTLSW